LARHAQVQRRSAFYLQCAVGGESYHLPHRPVDYRCECGNTCVPHCPKHGTPLHLLSTTAPAPNGLATRVVSLVMVTVAMAAIMTILALTAHALAP
jgi:hypothetical protein